MSSFCTHIFSAKKFQHICVSLDVNFNESLTNDIVSFEQLGPGDRVVGAPDFGSRDLWFESNTAHKPFINTLLSSRYDFNDFERDVKHQIIII